MPKYFLSGTKYEAFERMMMEPPRHYPAEREEQSRKEESTPPSYKATPNDGSHRKE